jgi:hypothetical protein
MQFGGILLVATSVVVESTAENHGIQKLAALLNFRKSWVILQGIRIYDFRSI